MLIDRACQRELLNDCARQAPGGEDLLALKTLRSCPSTSGRMTRSNRSGYTELRARRDMGARRHPRPFRDEARNAYG